jgi:short-subunit dehydrogenase
VSGSLAGRTALVTGASRGIGEYIVQHLLGEGMRVGLAARSKDDLQRVRSRLDPSGERTAVLACDVTDADSCRRVAAAAAAELGDLDVLVNNAGIEVLVPFAEAEIGRMRQIIEVNVVGLLQMTHAVLPGMLHRRRGQIVNIASLAGLTPVPYNAVYSASKHAVVGFTDSLRLELEGTGVGVSSICPGSVREAGMFTRHETGAPALAGTSSPAEVATAVLKAIKGDRRQIVVSAATARLSPQLRALAPRLYGRMLRASGVRSGLEQAARRAQSRAKLS